MHRERDGPKDHPAGGVAPRVLRISFDGGECIKGVEVKALRHAVSWRLSRVNTSRGRIHEAKKWRVTTKALRIWRKNLSRAEERGIEAKNVKGPLKSEIITANWADSEQIRSRY